MAKKYKREIYPMVERKHSDKGLTKDDWMPCAVLVGLLALGGLLAALISTL